MLSKPLLVSSSLCVLAGAQAIPGMKLKSMKLQRLKRKRVPKAQRRLGSSEILARATLLLCLVRGTHGVPIVADLIKKNPKGLAYNFPSFIKWLKKEAFRKAESLSASLSAFRTTSHSLIHIH